MTTTDEIVDSIEKQIDIDAPAQRVWDLVSRAAWWVNDGDVDAQPDLRRDGDLDVLTHPIHGEFRLRTEESDEPRYVRFAWLDNDVPDAGTRVEFWIEDRDGGVTLRVKESGFASLPLERSLVQDRFDDHTNGWKHELAAAQRFVVGGSA